MLNFISYCIYHLIFNLDPKCARPEVVPCYPVSRPEVVPVTRKAVRPRTPEGPGPNICIDIYNIYI